MCAIFVVVGNVFGQQPFQVTFIEGAAMPFFAFNLVGKPSAPFRGIHGVLLEAPDSTAKPCIAQVKTCR